MQVTCRIWLFFLLFHSHTNKSKELLEKSQIFSSQSQLPVFSDSRALPSATVVLYPFNFVTWCSTTTVRSVTSNTNIIITSANLDRCWWLKPRDVTITICLIRIMYFVGVHYYEIFDVQLCSFYLVILPYRIHIFILFTRIVCRDRCIVQL